MEDWIESIYSDGSKYFISNPLPKKGEKVKVYLRAYENSPIMNVYLKIKLNGIESMLPMIKEYIEKGLAYYSIEINIYEDITHYQFCIATKDKVYFYTQLQITEYLPDETYDFKILANYVQPSWVRESVFYQIFPERFCNGDSSLNVKDEEYYFDGHPTKFIKDWSEIPKDYKESFCLDFYGGDLVGIKNKIPYLKRLGINAIYLNPIFYAATVHKYDCLDYFQVDPHFGGDKAFEELMKELHKNNIKLILDTSINHTGTANKWFNKDGVFFEKSEGAYNNKDSKERKYYYFKEDNTYKAWFDVETLPTLNYTSKELRKILYEEENSLIKKWLKEPYNIDGWRFDVADTMARNDEIQLHHKVWPEIRRSIKEENKDAYILGEDWSDVSEFLKGNEWDSAMNYYGFSRPVREFLGENDVMLKRCPELSRIKTRLSAKNLANRIKQHLCKLPFVIQENQFNLFDSHDVPRLHNGDISFEDYRGAVIMLFTMIGTANMYYGDEIGIDGRIDSVEGCRYPMVWNENNEGSNYYSLYKTLINLKTSEDALKYGGFKIISDNDYVFSFARFNKDDVFITIWSTDDEERNINIPSKIFGKGLELGEKDIFGEELCYKVINEKVILSVKPHKSYLIKL